MFAILFYLLYGTIFIFAIMAFSVYFYEKYEKRKEKREEQKRIYDEIARNAIDDLEEEWLNR